MLFSRIYKQASITVTETTILTAGMSYPYPFSYSVHKTIITSVFIYLCLNFMYHELTNSLLRSLCVVIHTLT